MSDDATPDQPTVLGYRLTVGDDEHVVMFDDLTAAHTRNLRLATSVPGIPGSEWTEKALLFEYDNGLSMEGMAAHMFLAALQRAENPDFNRLLSSLHGSADADGSYVTETPEVDPSDPPG